MNRAELTVFVAENGWIVRVMSDHSTKEYVFASAQSLSKWMESWAENSLKPACHCKVKK